MTSEIQQPPTLSSSLLSDSGSQDTSPTIQNTHICMPLVCRLQIRLPILTPVDVERKRLKTQFRITFWMIYCRFYFFYNKGYKRYQREERRTLLLNGEMSLVVRIELKLYVIALLCEQLIRKRKRPPFVFLWQT